MAEEETKGSGGEAVERVVLRLYVTGGALRSARAIQNVRLLCETHLLGRYELEVIDLYQQPWLASQVDLVAAPTLVKVWPLPVQHFIGVLSDLRRLLESPGVMPASFDPAVTKALP